MSELKIEPQRTRRTQRKNLDNFSVRTVFSVVKGEFWWVVALLLLATFLSARDLTAPVWFDEYISIYNSGGSFYGPRSPAEIAQRVANDDFQTPGYYFLLAGWSALVGWTEYTGRILSMLCGLLSITLTYRLGRDAVSRRAGVAAATALGASAFFCVYLHEMRAYTLYALVAVLAVWAYWRLIHAPLKGGASLAPTSTLFVLGVAGLLYTHYFATLIVTAIAAYHLLFASRMTTMTAERWWRITLLMFVSGLLFLPWFGFAYATLTFAREHSNQVRHLAMDPRSIVQGILYMFSNGAIALLTVIGMFSVRGRRDYTVYAWFLGLFVLVTALLVNTAFGVLFSIRHLMGLFPILAFITAIGIDQLARCGVKPVFILSVWTLAAVWNTLDPTSYDDIVLHYARLPWNVLAQELDGHVQADDTVVFLLPYPATRPMHESVSKYYLHGLPGVYKMLQSTGIIGSETFERETREIGAEADRLWIAYDPTQKPTDLRTFDELLRTSHTRCATLIDTPTLHLDVFAPLPSANDRAAQIHFGDGVTFIPLIGMAGRVDAHQSITAGWEVAASVPPYTYSVGLHVLNEDGALVAQADYGLPSDPYSCRTADISVAHLPEGIYTVKLMVYDWSTGEKLPGVKDASAEQGDQFTLGTFRIVWES